MSASENWKGGNLVVKVVDERQNDIRRFKGNFQSVADAYSSLRSFVSSSFALDNFTLTYVDEEQDKITIASESDLNEALCFQTNGKKLFRILVSPAAPKQSFASRSRGMSRSGTLGGMSSQNEFDNKLSDDWYLPRYENENAIKKKIIPHEPGEWSVEPSRASLRTINPVVNIVDGLDTSNLPKDREFISLSMGDPARYPNLKTSRSVTRSVETILLSHKWNGYGPSSGMQQAKEAIVRKFGYPQNVPNMNESDVFLTVGCSDALNISICSILNENDTILLPRPGFSLYSTICARYGFKFKYYNCLAETGWEIDVEHLDSLITSNKGKKGSENYSEIKCILLNNPSNPCGSVLSRDNLEGLLSIAEKHKLPIISDDIYDGMVFGQDRRDYVRIQSLLGKNGFNVPVVTCGGISKQYSVPGWRCGWIILYDPARVLSQVKEAINNLTTLVLGPNTMIQAAVPNILFETPQKYLDDLNDTLEQQGMILFSEFNKIKQLSPVKPKGAIYLMTGIDCSGFEDIVDDIDFATKFLREESVLVLPGTIFGAPNYFRSVICPPPYIMYQVAKRMHEFCQRHQKKTTKAKL